MEALGVDSRVPAAKGGELGNVAQPFGDRSSASRSKSVPTVEAKAVILLCIRSRLLSAKPNRFDKGL